MFSLQLRRGGGSSCACRTQHLNMHYHLHVCFYTAWKLAVLALHMESAGKPYRAGRLIV